jgi:anti-anti-sigma regulatory factor
MPIDITWYDKPKTIILQTFDGEFSVEELSKVAVQSAAMVTSASHTIDLIIDFRKVNFRNANLIGAMRTVDRKTPDNQGCVVLVGVNPYLARLLGMAQRIAPRSARNLQVAKDVEEAMSLITRLRSETSS